MKKVKKLSVMFSVMILLSLVLAPMGAVLAEEGVSRPGPVSPGPDPTPVSGGLALGLSLPEYGINSHTPAEVGGTFKAAGDRLVALQRSDGGWAWPLVDNSTNPSPPNVIGPIGMGLAQIYLQTGDTAYKTALQNAGAFLLTKTNTFSAVDGYLAKQLDNIFEVTTYCDYVNTNFFDKLADGTYYRKGETEPFTTAGYVDYIRNKYTGDDVNIPAWDLGMALVGAASCGAGTTEWIAGVKASIDVLDGEKDYDVLGLAGALYGLAFVNEEFDPTAGEHVAANSLADLAEILAGYQIEGGGFSWNSQYLEPDEDNETNQETAYAILALNEVNRTRYINEIKGAADYLIDVQLEIGGWDNYIGDPYGENNETTAEAAWGIAAVYGGREYFKNMRTGQEYLTLQAAVDAASPGDTIITVAPYPWSGSTNVNKNGLTIKLNGATFTGGSPAMVISAADVTVQGPGIFDGSSSSDPAILVNGGADNFILDGVEIKNWANGVELAGSVASFKIVNNWIHDNAGSGLLIDSGVTLIGNVTIEGNLFKANGGPGITHNGAGTLLAEYNSWGAYSGPTGIVTDVDYTPWTFSEVYVDVKPDDNAAQVNVNEDATFSVAVKVDAKNLYAVQYKLEYDTDYLAFQSIADGSFKGTGTCINDTVTPGVISVYCTRFVPDGEVDNHSGETVSTITFKASGSGITGNGPWTTYLDLSDNASELFSGAKGGVKVFVNNGGFGAPSVEGRNITDPNDGEVKISGLANFTGYIDLQGRANDSGATLTVYDQDTIVGATAYATGTSVSSGKYTTAYINPFQLTVPTTYYFQVDAPLYLPTTAEATSGTFPTLPTLFANGGKLNIRALTQLLTVVLLGGDANNDNVIESLDMGCIGGAYGGAPTVCGTNGSSDVNGDGVVNIYDLVLMGSNYDKTSSPWTQAP